MALTVLVTERDPPRRIEARAPAVGFEQNQQHLAVAH
jgi:hypothetical protein